MYWKNTSSQYTYKYISVVQIASVEASRPPPPQSGAEGGGDSESSQHNRCVDVRPTGLIQSTENQAHATHIHILYICDHADMDSPMEPSYD